MVAKHK